MVKLVFISLINLINMLGSPFCEIKTAQLLPVEIYCVTVTPHLVSGEIPGSDRNEKLTSTYNPGALIKVFIRNNSSTDTLKPDVRFNGRTGEELLEAGVVSYCNTPGIRRSSTGLSDFIPPSSTDFYLLNVTDSNFYSKGIIVSLSDYRSGKSFEQTISIKKQKLVTERIIFTSSDNSKNPDGLMIFFRNKDDKAVTVTGIKLFKAGNNFRDHWWRETIQPENIEWFDNKNKISAGNMNGAFLKTEKLPFGEILVEIESRTGSEKNRVIFNIKPMVICFDFGMGWAEKDLAGSEAFCKTMSLLHLNTVNGNASAFFSENERAGKYEILKFSKLQDVEEQNKPENLKRIHGAEHFGEPQFSKRPAQEIYNYYTTYRKSGYPSTLTLSHEPGFFRYAGVVDFPHFDAYRVTAPHADTWGAYNKYGEKNVKWGAPLETIGFYMRTLQSVSSPYPVAAWTQGMSNNWSHRLRPEGGNPNNLEMRLQAYEAVANGAMSLYWFNMSGKNIIKNRAGLSEIHHINRELKIAGELISMSAPFSWINSFMDSDLNVLAGKDYAILFSADLKYAVSPENQFVSSGKRYMTMGFSIPAYLSNCRDIVKITHEGLVKIKASYESGSVTFADSINTTGLYVLYNAGRRDLYEYLQTRFRVITEKEKSLEFNPIVNDNDFDKLKNEIENIYK